MIKIRFTAQGANSVIGSFSSGDVANVGESFARHLVDEARVAEYLVAQTVAKPKQVKATKAAPAVVAVESAAAESVDSLLVIEE